MEVSTPFQTSEWDTLHPLTWGNPFHCNNPQDFMLCMLHKSMKYVQAQTLKKFLSQPSNSVKWKFNFAASKVQSVFPEVTLCVARVGLQYIHENKCISAKYFTNFLTAFHSFLLYHSALLQYGNHRPTGPFVCVRGTSFCPNL